MLAAWGYPAGAKRGRLWALVAAPSDDKVAWKVFLDRLPGRPELVVYDSDKAIHSAVRRKWPTVPIHLCEHHLYVNAKKHLREDGQEGWGNTYRTLLAAAGQSPEGWAAFRNAVLAEPTLVKTSKWVRFWDRQMGRADGAPGGRYRRTTRQGRWTRTSPPSGSSWNGDGGPSATCPG